MWTVSIPKVCWQNLSGNECKAWRSRGRWSGPCSLASSHVTSPQRPAEGPRGLGVSLHSVRNPACCSSLNSSLDVWKAGVAKKAGLLVPPLAAGHVPVSSSVQWEPDKHLPGGDRTGEGRSTGPEKGAALWCALPPLWPPVPPSSGTEPSHARG